MCNLELSIIVVSYNTADYTRRAIESIYEETKETLFEVIVVDNASTDNSVTVLNQHFPQMTLIKSEKNTGFAGGVCCGVEQARGQFLLLLNPDVLILDGAVDKLMKFAKQFPENGIWGGVTLSSDLTLNSQNAYKSETFSTLFFRAVGLSKAFPRNCLFNQVNYGSWNRDTVKEVDIITGCFFLTQRKVWDQLGGLDTVFFMYGEEADYCIRALAEGYQPLITPNARVIHHGGVSHTHFSGKLIKLLKGKVELINRHVSSRKKPVYKFLLFLYVFNKFMLYRLFKPNSDKGEEWRIIFENRKEWLRGYYYNAK